MPTTRLIHEHQINAPAISLWILLKNSLKIHLSWPTLTGRNTFDFDHETENGLKHTTIDLLNLIQRVRTDVVAFDEIRNFWIAVSFQQKIPIVLSQ
jgi:hypothetical protein